MSGSWTTVAAMNSPRTFSELALIKYNGRDALLATGGGPAPVKAVDRLNPVTGKWRAVSPMIGDRQSHVAIPLVGGKVLVAGGTDPNGAYIPTAETYDVAADNWSQAQSMHVGRAYARGVPLPDGTALVFGGLWSGISVTETVERYTPAVGNGPDRWDFVAPMTAQRVGHTVTMMKNGQILVTGGTSRDPYSGPYGVSARAETFDPATNTWTDTATPMTSRRAWHTATLLSSGQVLIGGGTGDPSSGGTHYSPLNTVEVYDPTTRTFTALDTTLGDPMMFHSAWLIPGARPAAERVLFTGAVSGYVGGSYGYSSTCWLYHDVGVTTSTVKKTTGSFNIPRWGYGAAQLNDHRVVVAGGYTNDGFHTFPTTETEIFQ